MSISDFVTQMVNQMWSWRITGSQITEPSPVFRNFCRTIITRSDASPVNVLLALKYFQKFGKCTVTKGGNEYSEANHFVVALMLSHKMLEDCTYSNETWSQITGIPCLELNLLEKNLLKLLEYDVHVSQEEFTQWILYVEQYVRHREPHQSTRSPRKYPSFSTAILSSWTRVFQKTC
ncbi:hypothetical protein K493DRAFT_211370 [Basidiobolus meristosporus CBS 931.73]|uniref:Cyclin N-terminal domain-containing protein n=1 Tax=Basidiobolus meristosporus CBS 931.73 TaxID=1314790 RepID=A0A1Y1YRL6_9FUNG|nr:hypothetical protein K493DRAFT_211370 [Basidiobolus meristosporus CBS 931.73]|eukprot:ORY00205.1 hypothetical protein K493DRAFT_211370 [Basidiobolus meristosporus CBS 931.73]